jgi:cytochrome c-type protein NapB
VAALIGVCFTGFLKATREHEYQPVVPAWTARPAIDETVATPARRYSELATRPWRSGAQEAGWSVDRRSLVERPDAERLVAGRSSGPRTGAAVADRAELRAFDGAPPTIPHPVRQRSPSECQACHAEGLTIGAAVAHPPSHPAYASCTQCHVVSASPVPLASASPAALARNGFQGLASPAQGDRAWAGAPPVIPHSTWMRQECGACHGVSARAGLHSTHPERASCTQCHAPSAALDQRLAEATLPGGSG